MRAARAALVLLLTVGVAAPALAADGVLTSRLVVEVADQARTGEAHEVVVTLTDQRGTPLAGQTVVVWERIRLFDYTDTVLVAEVRTNHQGRAVATHVPAAAGTGRIAAEYAGTEEYGAASATASFTIAHGPGVVTRVIPAAPEPLLPRGVTASWFLVLLVGVWLALGATVYHLVRIPRERGVPTGG